RYEIDFAASHAPDGALAVMVQLADGGAPAGLGDADPQKVSNRAAEIAKFSAKSMALLDVLAPHGSKADRLVVLGLGKREKLTDHDWLKAGGQAASAFKTAAKVVIYLDAPDLSVTPEQAADFALGLLLRAYSFDTYKTKKKD